MLPIKLFSSLEKIRLDLASLHQEVAALRNAYEAERGEREQIPLHLAALRSTDDEKNKEDSYKDKNYTVQVILAVGTLGAFFAAAVYAGIAFRQKQIMDDTLREIQSQTQAAQESAEAAERATLTEQRGERDNRRASEIQAKQASDALGSSIQQFELAHRPYLWQPTGIDNPSGNMHIDWGTKTGDPELSVTLKVQNFGQLPGIVTRTAGDVEPGGKPGYLDRLSAHHWEPYSSIIPPGRIDQLLAVSKETVPPHTTVIPHINGTMGVLLRVQYEDGEGNRFESDMCMYTPSGMDKPADYCPAKLI